MKEKRSVKKKLAMGAAGLASLVLVLCGVVYFYIQSNNFKTKIEASITDATGDQVEIEGKLTVAQMVPVLNLHLPAIKLQSSNPASPYERLRVDQLEVALPVSMLLANFQRGSIDLKFEKISVVSRASGGAPAKDSEAIANSLSDTVNDLRNQYSELQLSAFVGHIDYITRDGENLHYQVDDLAVNVTATDFLASGQFTGNNKSVDQFSLQLNELTQGEPAGSNQLQGNLIAAMIPHGETKGEADSGRNLSSVVKLQGDKIALSDISYTSPGIWARGELSVEPTGSKTTIKTDLELRKLEITSLLQVSGEASGASRIFNNDPLDLKFTEQLDIEAKIYLGAVRFNNEPVINGQLNLTTTKGEVRLVGEDLTLLGGDSDLGLSLKQLDDQVEMRFKLNTEDMQLERIRVDQSNAAVLDRGEGDIIVALRGKGQSTANIAASLNGYLTAAVSDAFVKRKYVSLIDQGIVSWARNKVSLLSKKWKSEAPSVKESAGLPLECASVRLFINNGRVEVSNGAIIEMPENTLVSSGYIDLHSEELGFVFRTKRESLFDWSAISIIKYLEIDGNLASPGFGLDLGSLAKQGVLSTTSLVYGPLPSLVYSLAEAGLKGRENIRCIADID